MLTFNLPMLNKNKPPQLGTEEREMMREACRFNSQLMDAVRPMMKPGTSTGEIDRFVYKYTRDHGHIPATLNSQNFPKSCCTSVNNVICHGIPGKYRLKEGDIVNLDLTTIVSGWHGDQSETFCIGEISAEARKVVQCAFDAMYCGIDATRPGGRVSEIGHAIVAHAKKFRFGVVRDFVGHGLGREFHLPPNIPHYPTAQSKRDRLLPGMCFTVEPMINAGDYRTVLDKSDGWTVYTRDNKLSAQFEHTVLMTEDGPEVLTYTKEGPQRGHKF